MVTLTGCRSTCTPAPSRIGGWRRCEGLGKRRVLGFLLLKPHLGFRISCWSHCLELTPSGKLESNKDADGARQQSEDHRHMGSSLN